MALPRQGAFVTVLLPGRGLHAKGVVQFLRQGVGVYAKGIVQRLRLGGGVYAKGIIHALRQGVRVCAKVSVKTIVYPLRRGIGVSRDKGFVVYHRLQVFGLFPLGVKVYRIAICPVGHGHAVYPVQSACAVRFCVPAHKSRRA